MLIVEIESYCSNFAAWLAYKVGIKVQYLLPATYASFGSPKIFRVSDDTKINVQFFEKYLAINIEDKLPAMVTDKFLEKRRLRGAGEVQSVIKI